MAATPANTVEVDPKLLERAQKAADERGLAVPQLVNTALEHELGNEAPQPPFLLIGHSTPGAAASAPAPAATRGRADAPAMAGASDVKAPLSGPGMSGQLGVSPSYSRHHRLAAASADNARLAPSLARRYHQLSRHPLPVSAGADLGEETVGLAQLFPPGPLIVALARQLGKLDVDVGLDGLYACAPYELTRTGQGPPRSRFEPRARPRPAAPAPGRGSPRAPRGRFPTHSRACCSPP